MLEEITIRVIPHKDQRYPTVGDWRTPEEGFEKTQILVSDLHNRDYEFLVAIHELIEMYLARRHGVRASVVTAFDKAFESVRDTLSGVDAAAVSPLGEPGDDPHCPVYWEHQCATNIERILCHELKIRWQEYEAAIDALE